jgi:hypothetical protein
MDTAKGGEVRSKGEGMDYTSFEFHGAFGGTRPDSDSRVLIRAKKRADVQDCVS